MLHCTATEIPPGRKPGKNTIDVIGCIFFLITSCGVCKHFSFCWIQRHIRNMKQWHWKIRNESRQPKKRCQLLTWILQVYTMLFLIKCCKLCSQISDTSPTTGLLLLACCIAWQWIVDFFCTATERCFPYVHASLKGRRPKGASCATLLQECLTHVQFSYFLMWFLNAAIS